MKVKYKAVPGQDLHTFCKKVTLKATSEDEEEILARFASRLERGELAQILSVDEERDCILNESRSQIVEGPKLSPADRSRLLYVLDALVTAPEKAQELLALAYSSKDAPGYKSFIERLSIHSSSRKKLMAERAKIRIEIL